MNRTRYFYNAISGFSRCSFPYKLEQVYRRKKQRRKWCWAAHITYKMSHSMGCRFHIMRQHNLLYSNKSES